MEGMCWFGVLLVLIAFGAYTAIVAQEKGYSSAWFFAGFFFNFIGLIAACGLPDRKKKEE